MMNEIEENQNAKSLKIFLFTLPDVNDMINNTYAY